MRELPVFSTDDHNAYEVDLSYDRNSNITWAYDRWNAATDVKYDMDDLNRLTSAQRGDESGGSVSYENFQQEWTLDQPGNWSLFKDDLNGDGDWTDTNEVEDARVHNEVNELETPQYQPQHLQGSAMHPRPPFRAAA